MAEKQLRTELIESGHKKLSEFLEHKLKYGKRVTDYERAIQQWKNTMTDFVSKVTFNLYSKVESLHHSLSDVQGQFQDLVKINKTLHDGGDQISLSTMTEISKQLSKVSPSWPSDFESFPLTLSEDGEIEKITLEESNFSEKELNLLKAILFDQHDKKSFLPPFESSALNPEDSFYTLEKKHLGVHVYDGANGTILKTSNPLPVDCSDENKATCNECGQPISVLLQIQMGRKKVESNGQGAHVKFSLDDRNNNDIHLSPLGVESKAQSSCPPSAGGSAKKIVSFQPKTIILEEDFVEEGCPTPKVREGVIRLADDGTDDDEPTSTRVSFTPGSPPLKEENIIHSASKSFQRRLSRGEVSDDGKTGDEKENPFGDALKPSSLLGLKEVKLVDTYDVKAHIMYPIMLAKHKTNLYVGSPYLKKICVFDTISSKGQGFLKLPDGKKFGGPRNVILYGGNKIMVLDEDALYLFHNGVLIKSLFCSLSSNFRGLSLDRSGNESQQTVVYTLEKVQQHDLVSVVVLDIEEEKVIKKVKVDGTKGIDIRCKFLCVASDIAVITDRGSGKIFKVDIAKNISVEVERPSFVKPITSTTGVVFHPMFNVFIVATTNKTLEILDSEGSWIKSMHFSGDMVAGLLLDGDDLYSAETLNFVKKYLLA